MLDLSDPGRQIAYYDPGVGTFAAAGAWTPLARWWSRTLGLAFGSGLRENLGEAYTWLMRNWEADDQVYIFGFSRGAYNARALVGLLRTLGLVRPGSENFVPYAVAAYSRGFDDMHEIAKIFGQPTDAERHTTVPIRYLGIWDTVKAAGFFRRSVTWPYTRQLPNAQRIRHAVSIDEHRRPFREYLIDTPDDHTREEVWFAGVHSDVGGTYPDDRDLSTITLKWVVEEAVAQGMLVEPRKYAVECSVAPSFASGAQHHNARWWMLLGSRKRPLEPCRRFHASVRDAVRGGGSSLRALPQPAAWADEDWAADTRSS